MIDRSTDTLKGTMRTDGVETSIRKEKCEKMGNRLLRAVFVKCSEIYVES